MRPEYLAILISGLGLVLTVCGFIYSAGIQRAQLNAALAEIDRLRKRDDKFTTYCAHVELIWDTLFKRGAAEGINKGLFTLNSPLKITAEAKSMLEVLRPKLRELYKELEPLNPSEQDLGIEIEKRYGSDIVKDVCVPNGLNLMACILIAIGVAKGTDTLDTILDRTSGTITIP